MRAFPIRTLPATDDSEDAVLAARAGIDLSRAPGSELHVVQVWTCVPSPRFSSHVATRLEREAQELLDTQVEKLQCAGGTVRQEVTKARRSPGHRRNTKPPKKGR
jgi:nucleotide-binding universal stress UspA family protein